MRLVLNTLSNRHLSLVLISVWTHTNETTERNPDILPGASVINANDTRHFSQALVNRRRFQDPVTGDLGG
jgi:hypothetical protein